MEGPDVISIGNASPLKGAAMTLPSTDYRLIPLTRGQFAKVDASDYGWLSQLVWHAWIGNGRDYYAQCNQTGLDGRRIMPRMHRLIMGLKLGDGLEVDHINHDTLDNRRSNLRVVTHAQNALNQRKRSHNTSGFKGVSFKNGRWQAKISLNYRQIYLGLFASAEEAGEAYRVAAALYHGDFRPVEEFVDGQEYVEGKPVSEGVSQ